jgi:Protein of unknown function (DUF2958)
MELCRSRSRKSCHPFICKNLHRSQSHWLLFGYVIGLEEEWGYLLLSEVEEIRGPLGLPVERALWFQPGPD